MSTYWTSNAPILDKYNTMILICSLKRLVFRQ